MKNVTIGADPELFIVNTKTGKVVSSIGLIPGEKNKAYRAPDMPAGYGIEIDNILAEFNIPAAKSKTAFIKSINYMKSYIRKYVQERNPDLDIFCAASMIVPSDQLQSPQAKLFGCDPDYNVYTETENPKPEGERGNLRSAGFHIHVGYSNINIETSLCLIRHLDATLGLMSVILDRDSRRRKLYGKAGSFRLQPWGVEYRVLSSAMMKNNDYLNAVWAGIESAINHYEQADDLPNGKEVEAAINNGDIKAAVMLLKQAAPELLELPLIVEMLQKK